MQDYYLQNSMSEGSYGMPSALQRNGRRAGQVWRSRRAGRGGAQHLACACTCTLCLQWFAMQLQLFLRNLCPRMPPQGFASAGPSTRPTIQRIVVVNRSAAQDRPERLHDSFGHVDYSDANSK